LLAYNAGGGCRVKSRSGADVPGAECQVSGVKGKESEARRQEAALPPVGAGLNSL
jgi:hypothetical protein